MENQRKMCFECLQRRIEADFNGSLTFLYGLSDSPLPFGSSAVVQMSSSSGGASPRFTLNYMPYREDDCLAKYIDESCSKDIGGGIGSARDCRLSPEEDHAEVSVGISGEKTTSLDSESQYISNGGRNIFLFGPGCENSTCRFSSCFNCSRTITSLAPIAQIGNDSYEFFEELASGFVSGSVENHVLHSLNLLIEGKASGRDGINFLSLVGLPSFKENGFPGCIRHPNIIPILGMLKLCSQIIIALPKTPYTLENILYYSPGALKSDWHVKFLIYQILSALGYMHGLGVAHGNLYPSNLLLTESSWCWLQLDEKQLLNSTVNPTSEEYNYRSNGGVCFEGCSSCGLYSDLKFSESVDWRSSFNKWWKGELSNFEYLLILNRLAGRRWGDHTFYTVMPWVVDFSVKPDENNDAGWRDLSKSKWRLAKGDEQLDFTYSTSEIPHHVSDECLSELAVCSYKARRLPLSVLRLAVRSVYEPNEYPSNMQRLYHWTPDECIPEFYCDPRIFYSVHSGMPDLAVPSWAGTPEEFVKLHRDALESNRVSCLIHHWIDVTFGYKMSGQAAVAAKNVMLPASASTSRRSTGRRQLFTRPHPPRRTTGGTQGQNNGFAKLNNLACEQAPIRTNLDELEEAASFCENSSHLNPLQNVYSNECLKDVSVKDHFRDYSTKITSTEPDNGRTYGGSPTIDVNVLLENIEVDDHNSMGYQELFLWSQMSSCSKISSRHVADDIFSIGCILAELHLRKPLFDSNSLDLYLNCGLLPKAMQELPHHTQVFVEACIQKDWNGRPSAQYLLESPYFPKSVKSSYLFLAPFHLMAKDESRLRYAATSAKHGAFKAMGTFGAEMCAPYCLPLVLTPISDTEAEWAYILLTEFLNCLKLEAVKELIVPSIQKLLQATGCSHLKVSLLQGSFMQEIWNRIGKQAYLETIHPLIISNLCVAPHKSSAAAAAVLLIGSSEEFGVPITVYQTILPLILYFGKGICSDGVDVVIRIGGLFGENFIMKHVLPLLRYLILSCIYNSHANKPEPLQSWGSLALIDCLATLDGLVPVLPNDMIVKELIEEGNCLYVKILMNKETEKRVLQGAAKSLIRVCLQIGPDQTALHVLPKLKELFDELAFSLGKIDNFRGSLKGPRTKMDEEECIESRMDLVLLLYPTFASLLGIEKLRQCCATWLLLEQLLLRHHNWKWEHAGEPSQNSLESVNGRRSTFSRGPPSTNTPAKILLNGAGWSTSQSRGRRGTKNFLSNKDLSAYNQNPVESIITSSNSGILEPWYWFPSPATSWNELDFTGRAGGPKDELPWKIRASIIQSVRAHHGALRSFAVCQDECTVFTAGVGPGFKGTIQKWELSRVDCVPGYNGHEEVVNDICVLSSSGRVASCDGTIHIWNGQTGKLVSLFSESSLASTTMIERDEENMLHFNPLSSGTLSTTFHGNSYTTMDHLEFVDRLVVGTGNGSLRFIDVNQGQKLNLWRTEPKDSGFASLISSVCSCGSAKSQPDETVSSPSWIAAASSTGYCRLFDIRSGKVIASWQAHDGYVTKLAAVSDHLLVSSSLDKSLRVWDLRRNYTSEPIIFRGYNDGVSGFSVWGQDVISICRNKIGLSSIATSSADEDGQHYVTPQHLYMADRESKSVSVLSAISTLPFSRLFLVGTEDGYLKICC